MKRILSLLLAVLLVAGFTGMSAFASDINAINPLVKPFADQVLGTINGGTTISIPLGMSSFTVATGIASSTDLTQSLVSRLRLTGNGDSSGYNSAFQSHAFTLHPADQQYSAYVSLDLVARNDLDNDTPFSFQAGIGLAADALSDVSISSTNFAYMSSISGTVKAKPVANGTILGFMNIGDLTPSTQVLQGGSFKIELTSAFFLYQGGTGTIDANKLSQYGISVSTTNSNFTASFVSQDGKLYIQLNANDAATVGNASVTITLTGTSPLMTANKSMSFNVPVTVIAKQVVAVNPAADTITGIKASGGSAPTQPAIIKELQINQTITFTINDDNFDMSSGGGDLNSNLAILNGSYQSDIHVGTSGNQNAYSSYFEKNFVIVGGSSLGIELKAINTGVLPSGMQVKLGGNNPYIHGSQLAIYSSATPLITGLGSGSITRTDTLGSNLAVGSVMTFKVPTSQFTWTPGSPQKLSSSNIAVTVTGGNFSVVSIDANTDGSATINIKATSVASSTNLNFNLATVGNPAVFTQPVAMNNLSIVEPVSASGNKIKDIDSGAYLGDVVTRNDQPLDYGESVDSLDVRPGDYIIFDFDSSFFEWAYGSPAPVVNVSQTMLRTGKITVHSTKRTGSEYIDHIEIDSQGGKAFVRVKFKKNLPITTDRNYSVTVYLAVNGRRHTDSAVTLSGVVYNPVQELHDGDDYIDLSDGTVAKPTSYLRDVEAYIGYDITVHTRMYSNRKYYGVATTTLTDDDEKMLDKYNNIVAIYNIKQANLESSASKVTFDRSERLYVYDEKGTYLGTTNDKVVFSSKYYLTDKKISITTSSSSSQDDDVVESSNSSSSGSGTSGNVAPGNGNSGSSGIENSNQNPYNGAANPLSGLVSLAVLSILTGTSLWVLGGKKER